MSDHLGRIYTDKVENGKYSCVTIAKTQSQYLTSLAKREFNVGKHIEMRYPFRL